MVSGTCRSYAGKRYKCAETNVWKKDVHGLTLLLLLDPFLINNLSKVDAKIHQKNAHQQTLNLMPKGVPKWSQNRCPKSSKNNSKTSNEKDQENHQKSCFSQE